MNGRWRGSGRVDTERGTALVSGKVEATAEGGRWCEHLSQVELWLQETASLSSWPPHLSLSPEQTPLLAPPAAYSLFPLRPSRERLTYYTRNKVLDAPLASKADLRSVLPNSVNDIVVRGIA